MLVHAYKGLIKIIIHRNVYVIVLSSSDRLEIRDLNEIRSKCWETRTKWFDIGLELNLEISDLEAIQQSHRDNVDKCFTDMIKKWLRTTLRPTQSELIAALRQRIIGFQQLADDLEGDGLKRDNRRQRMIGSQQPADDLERDSLKRDNLNRMLTNQLLETVRNPHSSKGNATKIKIKCDPITLKVCTPVIFAIVFVISLHFVRIHNSRLSPQDCYAGGAGLEMAIVGKKSTAVLNTVNRAGTNSNASLNQISCQVAHELTGQASECGVNQRWNNEQFEVSYQPTSGGKHQLHIKVEGEHIKGSPFNVTVKVVPVIEKLQEIDTSTKTIDGVKRPWGVEVNKRGEIVVAEHGAKCVSIFSPTGEKLRSFGSEGSGPGQFSDPRGVAVDDDGDIFVTDTHHIHKFSPEYTHITSLGSAGNNHLQFNNSLSIAISPITKNIAITDCLNHRIQILNPDLTFNNSVGSKGFGNGQFNRPYDVAFDSIGDMYVTDAVNGRIQVFDSVGNFLRVFLRRAVNVYTGYLAYPTGISIDSDDTV